MKTLIISDKITHLENTQLDCLKLSKERITVVRTILRSIHSTVLKGVKK